MFAITIIGQITRIAYMIAAIAIIVWIVCMFRTMKTIRYLKKENETIEKQDYHGFIPFGFRTAIETKSKSLFFLGIVCSISVLWSIIFFPTNTNHQIGSIFEAIEYTAYYEAHLYTDKENSKNYEVIAEIKRSNEYGVRYDEYYYNLRYVYFNKEQYIDFTSSPYRDNVFTAEQIVQNNRLLIVSIDGRSYFIKLTNREMTEIPDRI